MERHPDSPAAPAARRAAPAALFLPAFEPVPVRYRRDGWTPARQRAFIAALAEYRCVLEACRRVGKSPEAAYKLCRRADAAGFRAAWNAALAVRPSPAAPEPVRATPIPSPSSTSGREWQPSWSSASSTSAPSTSGAPAPPRPSQLGYSLDAFVRAARRARMAANGRRPT